MSSTRKKPTPPMVHVEPSSAGSTLDQHRQQMAGMSQALNQGGLPSLLPVDMDRKTPRAAASPVNAIPVSTSTTGTSASPKPSGPAALSPRPPSPATGISLSGPIERSAMLTVTSAEPSGTPSRPTSSLAITAEDVSAIESEADPARLRHLLYAARQQQRTDKATIDHQQNTIRELALKLNSVSEFIDMQEDLEDRLRGMNTEHLAQMNEQREMARVARLEMLESRVKLRSVEEELRRAHEADVKARANELLDARTAQVNEENFELIADRVMLSKDVSASKSKASTLSEQNTKLRLEADLRESTEKELLARTTKQKREIVDLKRQVKAMEDNLDKTAAEYEAQLATQKKTFAKELSTVTGERDAAQNDALRLHAELSKLRQLSSQMMSQRSELEAFFHAALADVKRDIVAERRQLIGHAAPGPSGTQTTSSALRIEGQPRLMLTDETSSARDRRTWAVDKRGFPVLVDPAKVTGKALPPIPPTMTQSTNSRGGQTGPSRDVVPWEWDGTAGYDDENDGVVLHNEMQTGASVFGSIPDAPTLRELKSIKIEELGWRDKERVLQSLFRRLQRSRPGPTRHGAHATADTSEVETHVEATQEENIPDDSDTFLTQQ